MNFNVSVTSIWSAIIDYVNTGEMCTLPVPALGCPSVGDMISLESMEEEDAFCSFPYAYVQVDGVYDYHSPQRGGFCPGMKLISFHVVRSLDDVVIS